MVFNRAAISRQRSSLSMTQGPAMTSRRRRPAISRQPTMGSFATRGAMRWPPAELPHRIVVLDEGAVSWRNDIHVPVTKGDAGTSALAVFAGRDAVSGLVLVTAAQDVAGGNKPAVVNNLSPGGL